MNCPIRPLRDLALIRLLPDETHKAVAGSGFLVPIPGLSRTAGFVLGEVAALGQLVPPEAGLTVGARVVVQGQSAPIGAPRFDGEVYGMKEGLYVFIPVRRFPSFLRHDEWRQREARMKELRKTFPQDDWRWKTEDGEKVLAALGEELRAIDEMKRERRRCGRDRFLHPTKDTAQSEGVLAVWAVE